MDSGEEITVAVTKHVTCISMVTSAASICMHHGDQHNSYSHCACKFYDGVYACIHELTSKEVMHTSSKCCVFLVHV